MVNGTYFAYSAFLDSRKACTLCPVVRWRRKPIGKLEIIKISRLLVMFYGNLSPKAYCQLWFSGKIEPVVAKVFPISDVCVSIIHMIIVSEFLFIILSLISLAILFVALCLCCHGFPARWFLSLTTTGV